MEKDKLRLLQNNVEAKWIVAHIDTSCPRPKLQTTPPVHAVDAK